MGVDSEKRELARRLLSDVERSLRDYSTYLSPEDRAELQADVEQLKRIVESDSFEELEKGIRRLGDSSRRRGSADDDDDEDDPDGSPL